MPHVCMVRRHVKDKLLAVTAVVDVC